MKSTQKIFDETMKTDHKVITEDVSKSILKAYGVKVPPYALAKTAKDAVKASKKIGFPLVMKIVSPQILHKTDAGGVKVGVANTKEVKKTFDTILKNVKKYNKKAEIKGVLLEKMVPKGVEMIVGLQVDPQFGPVIMAGLGGVMTEVFKDVAWRMLPITIADAKSMIEELKSKGLLIKQAQILHRTPISERSKTEIEFIEMPEFYLKQLEFKRQQVLQTVGGQ